MSRDEYAEYMEEQDRRALDTVYESFTEFKHAPASGKYYNMSEHGFRHVSNQGPWPLDPANFNIFIYGGSTTIHPGADSHSVASYLQGLLSEKLEKNVCVYNFGRSAYFSTQEKILHSTLLLKGHRPDLAIFFHGLNDFYFYDRQPVTRGCFHLALLEKNRIAREMLNNAQAASPQWGALRKFFTTLPLFRLASLMLSYYENISSTGESHCDNVKNSAATNRMIVDELLHNHQEIRAVSTVFGVKVSFFIQPVPTYGYDLQYHEPFRMLKHSGGFMGQDRAGDGYPMLLNELASVEHSFDDVFSLADIQRDIKRNIYVDHCHYTAWFASVIAGHMSDRLIASGIVNPSWQAAEK
ncbi:hypothetical protein NNJEOMEG_00418 [Fundidesulfovibrio magnetotacticus]|uniref:SGNH hydrolase-type esterase domain-containing protein n=2 Tax=Fundidesulfovibrio magnetotacticus TaxID=2730080 RepID=A0A6V8LIP7_9BACT|nr:hypothetical protein NNJEOMEG_00418 [Fundidesulfovibrio magnetotacticus]